MAEPVNSEQKSSAKSWCFTVNNWLPEDKQRCLDWDCNYLVLGEEVGDSGTPHLQGFVIWRRNYRFAQLKKITNDRYHWEQALASDAGNYCMKESYTVIDNRKQGKRNDINDAVETLKKEGLVACALQHPIVFVKCHKGLSELHKFYDKPRTEAPVVNWVWGPTGSGKTRKVQEMETDLWWSGRNLKWWQGYRNQEAVIFDDFRGDFCTFHELLRILDRYPYEIEIKGGSCQFNSKRIWITSCFHPKKVYQTREDIAQLLRRIHSIYYVEKGVWTLENDDNIVMEEWD